MHIMSITQTRSESIGIRTVNKLNDLPDWIQIGGHGSRTSSCFADVHGNVWIGGARLVLGDQALSADDWKETNR